MSPARAYRLYQRETLGRDLRLESLDVIASLSPRELQFFIVTLALGTLGVVLIPWSAEATPAVIVGAVDFAWLRAVLRASSARRRSWMLRAALVCALAGAMFVKARDDRHHCGPFEFCCSIS